MQYIYIWALIHTTSLKSFNIIIILRDVWNYTNPHPPYKRYGRPCPSAALVEKLATIVRHFNLVLVEARVCLELKCHSQDLLCARRSWLPRTPVVLWLSIFNVCHLRKRTEWGKEERKGRKDNWRRRFTFMNFIGSACLCLWVCCARMSFSRPVPIKSRKFGTQPEDVSELFLSFGFNPKIHNRLAVQKMTVLSH